MIGKERSTKTLSPPSQEEKELASAPRKAFAVAKGIGSQMHYSVYMT